jgi:glycogen debranching enzyme
MSEPGCHHVFDFGREVCSHLAVATEREWLVTNGIGGYASGTIAGVLTRRYHGLLVAALNPPLGRTLLVTKLDETVACNGDSYPLSANRWGGGMVDPTGYAFLERFHLEGATPVWTYGLAKGLLEKRIWMQPGANTTYIRYDHSRGESRVAGKDGHHRSGSKRVPIRSHTPVPRPPTPRPSRPSI